MKRLLLVILLLAAGAGLYTGWGLWSGVRIAQAAGAGQADTLIANTDMVRLRRSLARQVVVAYVNSAPELKALSGLARSAAVAVGTSAVEALVADILTPERIAAVLADRTTGEPAADLIPFSLRDLAAIDAGDALTLLSATRFANLRTLVVTLGADDQASGAFGLHLRLTGGRWLVAGLDLPPAVTARIVEIVRARQANAG